MTVPRPVRSRRRTVARVVLIGVGTGVAVVALAAGLLVATVHHQAQQDPGGDGEYVALGSSFAAGPGVGERAGGSPWACLRSAENYPRRVADALGLSLTDVTCSGATTADVLEGGQYFLPAQVDALVRDTRLVTVTVGGNDVAFLGNLTGRTCRSGELSTPAAWRALGACDVVDDSEVAAALRRLPDALRDVVEAVRRRSPTATVVLVDYQAVLPEQGGCDRLPLRRGGFEHGRSVQTRLNRVIADVAEAAGVEHVSAHAATVGHDLCARDPWVSPYAFPRSPLSFAPIPYHPTRSGVAATADAIEQHLRGQGWS